MGPFGTGAAPHRLPALGLNTAPRELLHDPHVTNYSEAIFVPPAGSSFTIDLDKGTHWKLRTDGNLTVAFPAIRPALSKSFILEIEWGGTHTMTWPATSILRWPAATAPTVTGAINKADVFAFFSNGVIWSGATVGLNYVW